MSSQNETTTICYAEVVDLQGGSMMGEAHQQPVVVVSATAVAVVESPPPSPYKKKNKYKSKRRGSNNSNCSSSSDDESTTSTGKRIFSNKQLKKRQRQQQRASSSTFPSLTLLALLSSLMMLLLIGGDVSNAFSMPHFGLPKSISDAKVVSRTTTIGEDGRTIQQTKLNVNINENTIMFSDEAKAEIEKYQQLGMIGNKLNFGIKDLFPNDSDGMSYFQNIMDNVATSTRNNNHQVQSNNNNSYYNEQQQPTARKIVVTAEQIRNIIQKQYYDTMPMPTNNMGGVASAVM